MPRCRVSSGVTDTICLSAAGVAHDLSGRARAALARGNGEGAAALASVAQTYALIAEATLPSQRRDAVPSERRPEPIADGPTPELDAPCAKPSKVAEPTTSPNGPNYDDPVPRPNVRSDFWSSTAPIPSATPSDKS